MHLRVAVNETRAGDSAACKAYPLLLDAATVGAGFFEEKMAGKLAGKIEIKCAPYVRAAGFGLNSAAFGVRDGLHDRPAFDLHRKSHKI